jgi:adenylate cyclase class 2
MAANAGGTDAHKPYVETEIKLRWDREPEAAVRMLEEQGYRLIESRTLEADQLFDREGGAMRAAAKLLRLRRTGGRATVTYKGPPAGGRHKSREEIEFDASDADAFARVLDRLGYAPSFRYEKYRTKYAIPGEPGFVTVDETPIGTFLELEGAADWIDGTAARLGFPQSAYVTASYSALYREYRQSRPEAPANMVFNSEDSL